MFIFARPSAVKTYFSYLDQFRNFLKQRTKQTPKMEPKTTKKQTRTPSKKAPKKRSPDNVKKGTKELQHGSRATKKDPQIDMYNYARRPFLAFVFSAKLYSPFALTNLLPDLITHQGVLAPGVTPNLRPHGGNAHERRSLPGGSRAAF